MASSLLDDKKFSYSLPDRSLTESKPPDLPKSPPPDAKPKQAYEPKLTLTDGFTFTSSGSTTSKLKKFNVNTTPTVKTPPSPTAEAELKRKQEQIRIENEAEKEKNRRIIQELVVAKDFHQKSPSPCESLRSASTPLATTIITESSPRSLGSFKKSFMCQRCNMSASITERVRLQGLVYHRECIRCCQCDVVVKNAENFSRRDSNDQIDFYCVNHTSLKSNLSVSNQNQIYL